MIRSITLAVFLPTFAAAWEFSPSPLCTLSHQSDRTHLEITYDPGIPEYRMSLDLLAGQWTSSKTFGMTFRGGRTHTIRTDRHEIDEKTLMVSDTGFGNVLDGLEFNAIAIAFTTSQSELVSLASAAPAVRKFRRCARKGPPTS
ncbi:MAG: excinuclease ABC subunit B [Pseudomonadota bacterium]